MLFTFACQDKKNEAVNRAPVLELEKNRSSIVPSPELLDQANRVASIPCDTWAFNGKPDTEAELVEGVASAGAGPREDW
jgi:hypothetical protein